jgi:hypothetical protein
VGALIIAASPSTTMIAQHSITQRNRDIALHSNTQLHILFLSSQVEVTGVIAVAIVTALMVMMMVVVVTVMYKVAKGRKGNVPTVMAVLVAVVVMVVVVAVVVKCPKPLSIERDCYERAY